MEPTLSGPNEPEPQTLDPALFWRWAGRASRPVVGWVLIGLGALAILVGYFGISDRVLVAEQLPYLISGGIGGMALVIIGGVMLATQDVRRDADRLDDFERTMTEMQRRVDDLHRVLLRPVAPSGPDPAAPPVENSKAGNGHARTANGGADSASRDRVYVVSGGTTFHRDDCRVLRGKDDVSAVAPSSARRRRLTPCLLCEPS